MAEVAAAAEEVARAAAVVARRPSGGARPAAAAAPGPVAALDPAAAHGHLRAALLQMSRSQPCSFGRTVLPGAAVMQIGREAARDNRLANCPRPGRGRREAAIGQPPEIWLLEIDRMLGNAPATGKRRFGNRPNVGNQPGGRVNQGSAQQFPRSCLGREAGHDQALGHRRN